MDLVKYNGILKSLDSITDRLGMPIDKPIRHLVAALNYSGFPTVASCAGHIERKQIPWVRIGVDSGEIERKTNNPLILNLADVIKNEQNISKKIKACEIDGN